ncbi:outer membrane beta-barrel protein [Microbulbifer sp. VAAC004]|uniref:outer membrane beta-barrel protein n=1 Tax=unclassified Microbulbifer TaxID=2619833 RepID=UPI00403987D2
MNKLILASVILFSASNSMATENNFYLRSSYGKVDTNVSSYEASANIGVDLSTPKGWTIALGYRLNRFFALEAGYADLGDADGSDNFITDESYDLDSGPYTSHREVSRERTLSIKSKMLGILFTTDVTKDFYAGVRTGFHSWDADLKYKSTLNMQQTWTDYNGNVIDTESTNFEGSGKDGTKDSDFYYGISAGWNYNNWSLSLEHTIFNMDKKKPTLSSLALTYNF